MFTIPITAICLQYQLQLFVYNFSCLFTFIANYSCLFTFQLSLQDTVNLVAQYCKSQYDTVMQNQRGDSFYIRTHFNYDQPEMPGEMPFGKSEVFHVVDTLHNGVVGSWQALRVNPGNKDNKIHRGVVPNKARAEELATKQFNQAKKEQSANEQNKNSSIFRRRRDKNGRQRRSKSLGKVNKS